MSLFEHFNPFLFAHTSPLVEVGVAGEAQGSDPVIVGLEPPSLAVSELVGVGSDYGAIADAAVLTR